MSNKRSDYGSLADRARSSGDAGRSPDGRRLAVGVHVWVKDGAIEIPGLLAGWQQQLDSAWWGRVVMVVDGQPAETLIRSDLLRKAN